MQPADPCLDQHLRYRWLLLLIACGGTAAFQVGLIAYAPLLDLIATDLGVGVGTATNLMSIALFSGSIAFLLGGWLSDRLGVLPVLMLGSLTAAAPAAILPWFGDAYPVVLAARFVQGASAGFIVCTMSPIMASWFPPPQKGLVGGLLGGSVALGSAIGVLAAPALLPAVGRWQVVAAWLAVPSWLALLAAAALLLTLRCCRLSGRPQPAQGPVGGGDGLRDGLSAWVTWVGVLVTFFASWSLQSLYNLAPAYFAAARPAGIGFGPMAAGQLMLALMLSGIVAPIVGGLLQDKVFGGNAKPVIAIGFLLSAGFTYAILSPAVYGGRATLVTALVLAGSGITFLYPAIAAFVSVSYSQRIVGTMLGLWMGLGNFGGAVGLFVGGRALSSSGTYAAALLPAACAGIAGLVFSAFLRSPNRVARRVPELGARVDGV